MNTNAFPSPLVVLNKADGSKYPFILKEDFSYVWSHRGVLVGYELPTFEIKVPAGYSTDFGSLPRITQGIFNAVNDIAPAATIHDWCYSVELFPRNICDKVFYDALRDNGVGYLRAKTLYSAVRLFGWTSWPHPPESIAEERELYRERFGEK
jgi:hypothetical protein